MKTCNKCKKTKPFNLFPKDKSRNDGYAYRCSECKNNEIKKYYKKNKDVICKKNKGKYNEYYKQRYNTQSPEQKQQFREYLKEWNNKEENKEKRKKYLKEIYRKKPQNKILIHLRKRVNDFIKGVTKKQKYLDLLGCSSNEYKLYLEKQFDKNMNWDNYGTYWEIDHIKPLSLFNMEDWIERKKAFHFTNTQPLSVIENRKKSSKYSKN